MAWVRMLTSPSTADPHPPRPRAGAEPRGHHRHHLLPCRSQNPLETCSVLFQPGSPGSVRLISFHLTSLEGQV